ncbi:MAG: c-type cytochrome [Planctomycetes bacterium]|nr:c-type cytochrome [Planctomycetota bacterium]
MRFPVRDALSRWLALLALVVSTSCGSDVPDPARRDVPPVIAGLDADGLEHPVRGRALLGELGCVACHDPGGLDVEPVTGPDLRTVGTRVDARYLREFLASPHDLEPGTVMPDLLRRWRGAELQERVDALWHFLRSLATEAPVAATPVDAAAATRGGELYRRIGCRNCHPGETAPAYLGAKYTIPSLQRFLLAPHEARPSRRMPDFSLSPAEANDLANFLVGPKPVAAATRVAVDAKQAARGKQLFAELRCARCHDLGAAAELPASPPAPPLAAVDVMGGCMSGRGGAWPHYTLTSFQLSALRVGIAAEKAPSDEQRVRQRLAQRRCFACHRRGEVDALAARQQEQLFGTDDANLGDEGRIPPPLSDVGAKLQRPWLERTIAHGQRERPYLHVRMPGFGEAFAAELAGRLAAADTLPPIEVVPLPGDDDAARKITDVGRELVGDQGMSCITCHRFAGEQAGTMGAIDLVHTTGERLRPEWFAHFLRDPFRFKPGTLMPHFFPGGVSTRPQFADGSVQRQIDAIWHYLAEGRNVRKPSGLHQPAIELVVGDEAVMLRRAVQGAGKRGISVGYPGAVNVTFDAENLGMNQLWWGRFVDARPVWTSQGHGQAQLLSRDVFQLPNGPAWAVLAAPDAPWPTATRRERGDRWLGYDLDEARRPTFRYTAGDVAIADGAREQRDGDVVRLRRRLSLTCDGRATLWLRAAVHAKLTKLDERSVRVGDRLCIDCGDTPWSIVTVAGQAEQELRLRVEVDGSAKLTIGYRVEEGR